MKFGRGGKGMEKERVRMICEEHQAKRELVIDVRIVCDKNKVFF